MLIMPYFLLDNQGLLLLLLTRDETETTPMLEVQCDMAIEDSEADLLSAMQVTVLESTTTAVAGNPKLRAMNDYAVRRVLRKALMNDAAALARWERWSSDWKDSERTYASAQYRAFERGERGGRQ